LTDERPGTTMEPANSVRPESTATFLKCIGDTSRCHPLCSPGKTIFRVQNVPLTEQRVVKNG
jgi:hypothetical protein